MAVSSKMSVDTRPRPSPQRAGSEDSTASTPERDLNVALHLKGTIQEPAQPKRKGGRKPIYATSEERKQRNRQAQAAFRERRTEYIKQLEETIQVHETNLHNLQSAHRNAADECLMLRYKNSLLERILLEKNINVHAELQAKAGSPFPGAVSMSQSIMQPLPVHSQIMDRARKPLPAFAPKIDTNTTMTAIKAESSPQTHPLASPSNTVSSFSPLIGSAALETGSADGSRCQISAAATEDTGQLAMDRRSESVVSYSTPAFNNHLDQLDSEYDQGDMVQDSEMDGTNSDPFHCFGTNDNMMATPDIPAPNQQISGSGPGPGPAISSINQLLGQNMDWDPFGLSASMTFPTQQFQFEQTSPIQ